MFLTTKMKRHNKLYQVISNHTIGVHRTKQIYGNTIGPRYVKFPRICAHIKANKFCFEITYDNMIRAHDTKNHAFAD